MDAQREEIERLVRQVVLERLQAPGAGPELHPGAQPRRPLVAANWKMNGSLAMARAFPAGLALHPGVEVVLCPPLALLAELRAALHACPGCAEVALGAQNLHPEPQGAFTGEHGPAMVREAGCRYAILGHSERRDLFGEDDAFVARKLGAALQAGLRPILCVGEHLAERESGATFRVLRGQLTAALAGLPTPRPAPEELAVAYEPIWAIGTGRNATAAQAGEALAFLRERLAEVGGWAWAARVRLLYGGSANPDNAAALAAQPDVDGFLVGGASLVAAKLSAMIAAVAARREEARAR